MVAPFARAFIHTTCMAYNEYRYGKRHMYTHAHKRQHTHTDGHTFTHTPNTDSQREIWFAWKSTREDVLLPFVSVKEKHTATETHTHTRMQVATTFVARRRCSCRGEMIQCGKIYVVFDVRQSVIGIMLV